MAEAAPNSDHQNTPTSSDFSATLLSKTKQNLIFRSKWAELNGAMGDLGTYIPIILALTLSRNLNLGTTLIFTGAYNIITGALYGVPMPVQPMKSIAAAAISSPDFGVPEIMAAGICTGGILLVLGVTGLMKLVYKLIPLSIVRGIQLAQGLNFAMTAVKYVRKEQNFAKSKSAGNRDWLGLDGLVLAIVCFCFIVVVNGAGEDVTSGRNEVDENRVGNENRRKTTSSRVVRVLTSLPSAFMIFVLGVILAFVRDPHVADHFKFGPSTFSVVHISKEAWKNGFIKGTIPQLPLSILNSVVAVCKLSYDLFPDKDCSATSVSITVGLMNLVGTWFGAMPC
uniref:Molybdate transporter 1 n=1 Tax=Kalanchoe fedtschenkoi TaxID=63787 RepID=A0A7N0V3A0_KALFE